jgi:hypothetical protein
MVYNKEKRKTGFKKWIKFIIKDRASILPAIPTFLPLEGGGLR